MKRIFSLSVLLVVLLAVMGVATAQAPDGPVDETLVYGLPGLAAPIPGGAAVPAGELNYTVLDDFNRADGPIGPDWEVHDGGYFNIVSNAVQGGGYARATYSPYSGDGMAAEADVAANGTNLQFTGLVLNFGYGTNNPFLKIQQQSPYQGQFTHGACYLGSGSGSFGLGFFTLSSPFTTAHMKASRVGNTVTIEFTNVDGGGQSDQTYVCDGAPSTIDGNGIGIVGYAGIARLDNFGVPGEAEPMYAKIKMLGRMQGGAYVANAIVRVRDAAGGMVEGADVTVFLKKPNGNTNLLTRTTDVFGRTVFPMASPTGGYWLACLEDVQHPSYTWDDSGPKCAFMEFPEP